MHTSEQQRCATKKGCEDLSQHPARARSSPHSNQQPRAREGQLSASGSEREYPKQESAPEKQTRTPGKTDTTRTFEYQRTTEERAHTIDVAPIEGNTLHVAYPLVADQSARARGGSTCMQTPWACARTQHHARYRHCYVPTTPASYLATT